MAEQVPKSQNVDSSQKRLPESGLSFSVASSLNEIIAAWRLVYQRYVGNGLICPNPYGLHTVEQTIYSDTSVVVGALDDQVVSTLTIMHDNDGLPLDSVYGNELNALRDEGRQLLEVGLLADRRDKMSRCISAIFQLIRFPYFNAKLSGRDMLAGVHPHHAGFYQRTIGFEPWGPAKEYPRVNRQPVVLLRVNIDEVLTRKKLPKATAMFEANPLPTDAFDQRYSLNHNRISGTPIGAYLSQYVGERPTPHSAA